MKLTEKDFGIAYKDDLTDLDKLYNLEKYRQENDLMEGYYCPQNNT